MKVSNTLYVTKRSDWRKWLSLNFKEEKEIWLVFPRKSSGKPRLSYDDAVLEALCFGWIDSTIKSWDEEAFVQRFTPRNPKSSYSQPNKERLRHLIKETKIHPSVRPAVEQALEEEFVFPPDILESLKIDKQVWSNYQGFSPAYQRIRIAYIEKARERPEEFKKRLQNFIEKTRQNKMIGFGGIEKHY